MRDGCEEDELIPESARHEVGLDMDSVLIRAWDFPIGNGHGKRASIS